MHVTTERKTKPQHTDEVIAILSQALPDTLDHDGCEVIQLRRDQDDPTSVVSFTQWASRRHYEQYLCRADLRRSDMRLRRADSPVASRPPELHTSVPLRDHRPGRTQFTNYR